MLVPEEGSQPELHRPVASPFIQEYSAAPKPKYAFVLAASHKNPDQLWGALAITQMLHRLSRYPIVLLSDIDYFPDGAPVKSLLRQMGVDVRPLSTSGTSWDAATMNGDDHESAAVKLQVWNMTEFDKIVWLSADTVVYRNVDWLFEREGTWASRRDPECHFQATELQTSLMMLQPSEQDFKDILAFAEKSPHRNMAALLYTFFANVRQRPIQLLSEMEASGGQCLSNGIPTPYRNADGSPVRGAWSLPAFVHRSGGFMYGGGQASTSDNVCFSIHLEDQVITGDDGRQRNVCHYHPLAAYWRDSFCVAAVRVLDVKDWKVSLFCEDACYYKGSCDDSRVLEVKQ